MTSINLVFRPSTRVGRHPGSLSLRLIHNRRVKTVTIPDCRLYPEEWNKKTQEVIYPANNPHRTACLELLENKIRNEVEVLNNYLVTLEKRGRYNLEDLLELYHRHKDEGKLLGYAETLARQLERRGQVRTANAYRTVARGILKFNKYEDIPLGQINECLIKDFEKYLKDKGKLPNTVSYYMRNLRAIFNKAVADKRVVKPRECPFTDVYKGVTKTMKRALSLDEVQMLHALDFEKYFKNKDKDTPEYKAAKNLYHARQYFGFCFYARGMSFVDMAYLRKENIRGGFIRYVRKKTGQQMEVKVTAELQEIIDGFSSEVLGSPYVFPIIKDNGKSPYKQYETGLRLQNYHLKKLAALAGIKKQISTHWARHSWASIGKKEHLSIQVISECLGHTSEKTTLIYLDSLDNSLLDAANEIVISAVCRHPVNNLLPDKL
ncbi:phage integrase SAM-like domain-containing protein [Parabacteroides sp.]